MIDYNNLDLNCPKTWKLFHEGKTKGVFQLETNLGRAWSRRIMPSNIEELSALISLMRPGCLRSILDGKSMTQHYADRKNGAEEVTEIDPAVNEILTPTYQTLVYQEQVMAIAQKIAGFTLQEADELRKGVGKKDPELLNKVGEKFLKGCENTKIVTKEKAEEIWSYIVKGARYLFNKCLSPTTIVETIDGPKTLDELNIGDKILAPNVQLTENEYVDVIDKIENGEQELYKIILESGKEIECTLTHKFMCEGGQIHELSEILVKNYRILCEND